jgi:hypothetical protein
MTEIRCGYCRDQVDPTNRKVVYAVKREHITTEEVEGPALYFHRTCLALVTDYREKPKPQ